MKKYALNDITPMQFTFLIHGAQVGIGLLSLPKDLALVAGTDGWISLLIGWLVALLSSLIIIQVMKKHPDDTLYDLLPRYFGRWMGSLLKILVILYFLFGFFTVFIASVFIMKLELMPRTPNFMLALLFAIPLYTIARNQIRVLGRYAQLTFWGLLWLVFAYMYPLKDAIWLNILPIVKDGWIPILIGAKTTALSFIGFETVFILYPFLKDKTKAVPCVLMGNTLTMLAYMIVCLVCFLYFSPDDITSHTLPSLKSIKVVEFRFMERFEVVFLVAYVYMLSRVWILYLYYATFGSSQLLGKQDHRLHLRIVLIGMLIAFFFYSPTFEHIEYLEKWFSLIGIGFAFAVPPLLWAYTSLLSSLRKEKQG